MPNEFSFTPDKLPFSRRLSYLSVEQREGSLKILRQGRNYSTASVSFTTELTILQDGAPLPFTATAKVGRMTAATDGGSVDFTFDGAHTLRIRCSGVAAAIAPSEQFEIARLSENELAVRVKGDAEPPVYRGFDECVADCEADFAAWFAMYPPIAERYAAMKRQAVYMVWISQIAPRGKLREPAILYTKPTDQSCFSWHQVYHAMAMSDADNAVQTLMNLFPSQDDFGELPDLMDDRYINITATKPPFHGYGLLYMLRRLGDSITESHCRRMYSGLSKLFEFWTTLRDTDGDGVPQYNHGCESGYDFSLMFQKGVPVETPDIISYILLLAEGLSKLAERLGLEDEAAEWQQKSDYLLKTLLSEFWTGERFIARLSGLHEVVEFDELEAYLPLMLGNRLPREVVSRLARDLADPEMYFTPHGLRSQPKTDRPGVIMGFSQIKILPGLYLAGERETALSLLRGFCDYCAEHTPSFLFVEPSEKREENPGFAGFTDISALSASIWLGCAAFLEEAEHGTV